MTEWFARSVLHVSSDWGYRVLVIDDLDGNQLFFPYPNEPQTKVDGLVIVDAP